MDYRIDHLTKHLSELRLILGMSQTKFGENLGCTRQTICNYETGQLTMGRLFYLSVVGLIWSIYEYDGFTEEEIYQIRKCFIG